MRFKSVRILLKPLLKEGKEWQNIDINGNEEKPYFYFSNIQWAIIFISILILFRLKNGISTDIIGYVMSAFSISVSLFMSLLVSIFDKFENTEFINHSRTDQERDRLKQKKNFFKRFIAITSYLVVLSVFVIVLCSVTYLFNLSDVKICYKDFTINIQEINPVLTLKNIVIIIYRAVLNYFLLNYLLLTLFITGSAYEYYMSELNNRRIL